MLHNNNNNNQSLTRQLSLKIKFPNSQCIIQEVDILIFGILTENNQQNSKKSRKFKITQKKFWKFLVKLKN